MAWLTMDTRLDEFDPFEDIPFIAYISLHVGASMAYRTIDKSTIVVVIAGGPSLCANKSDSIPQ